MIHGYYSLGLCGYEIWDSDNDSDKLNCLFVGTNREQIAREYKIQYMPNGRPFIRPNGRRIYLDEVLVWRG